MRILTSTLLALSLLFTLSACGDDDKDDTGGETVTNPLDGTWNITTITCDGQEAPIGQFTLFIDGDGGQFVQGFGPECVLTLEEEYKYPTDASIEIIPTSVSCDPNSGCAAVFGGADCLPLSPAVTFDYTRDGDSLVFSKTAAPGDACPEGTALVVNMTKG